MKKKSKATLKEGNIFEDLGFDKAEAANLLLRAELMVMVKKYIEKNKLTQSQAAKKMKVDQPRINKLLKGKINLFTIDMLVQMLERVNIQIRLKKAA